jgi:hypothetical protein
MNKPTNKQERDALIKELQEMKFALPTRWEEMERLKGYYVDEDCNPELTSSVVNNAVRDIFPTSEQAEASIYLAMLLQLRDIYREGWTPDWGDCNQIKHGLALEANQWRVTCWYYTAFPFSFPTSDRAELFKKNFGDYLEKVKPLFI